MKKGKEFPLRVKIPEKVPAFLEDALCNIYSGEVRELGMDENKFEIHCIYHPQTKELIGAFNSYLTKAPVPAIGSYGYQVRLEITQGPSDLESLLPSSIK